MAGWLNWMRRDRTTIPMVRLSGAIGMAMPFRPGLSVQSVETPLTKAFAMKGPAVAIVINSPGGAAAQSHLIHKRIRQLAEEKKKHVIVAVEDVAASGGYMIACAGDEIIADPGSIVGSIGVISASFGFQDLIQKIGVERRVHTAGRSKSMLDPFRPEKAEDVARLRELQDEVHGAFIDLVKSRRGAALKDDPDLFTGAFWSGAKAKELGLVDRLGDLHAVLRERYGEKVEVKPVAAERGFLRRRLGLGAGVSLADLPGATVAAIEERLLWSRFGL
ncbi:MAG: S49 family peptidase [Rhizobiales bacterium]|nr:S49 family peptidase [Hyphomicrobiales bacterium]MBN9010142.1 S49 family peptidase [Hyphomicrobiales bacterium]